MQSGNRSRHSFGDPVVFHSGKIFHCDCDRQGTRRGHAESRPVVVVIALSRKIPVREFCIERGMGVWVSFRMREIEHIPSLGTCCLRQSNVNPMSMTRVPRVAGAPCFFASAPNRQRAMYLCTAPDKGKIKKSNHPDVLRSFPL